MTEGNTAPLPTPRERLRPTRVQQLIAGRMAQSRATVPDFVLRVKVDMDELAAKRSALKRSSAPNRVVPSFNDFIIKASALSLREHPQANGSFHDGEFHLHGRVNIGVAIAAPGALVVATVFDADRKPIGEIAHRTRELAEKVRRGAIMPADIAGGTFTVSNLGMLGVHEFDAVVNPPQAAILSVGQISEEPVVHAGAVVVRRVARLGLSCDHRILYGADAAGFLTRIKHLLEAPTSWAGPSSNENTSR